MIEIVELKTEKQFKELRNCEILIIEWKTKIPRLETFKLAGQLLRRHRDERVLLNISKDIYFNYKIFLRKQGDVKDVKKIVIK